MDWLQILMQVLYMAVLGSALCIGGSICAYLYRRKAQQLPEYQRVALQQFAEMAVQSVEQLHKKMLSGDTKKSLALSAIAELYKAHPQLKEPTQAVIEIALESAVFWLGSSRQDMQQRKQQDKA